MMVRRCGPWASGSVDVGDSGERPLGRPVRTGVAR